MNNIFENLYNNCNESTIAPFERYPKFPKDKETNAGTYCRQPDRNSREEFLTQVFTNVMLEDASFRQAFLDELEIADGDWKFWAEHYVKRRREAEKDVSGEAEKDVSGEMDVYGKADNALLIIENKLDSEIDLNQPKNYARIFAARQEQNDGGEEDYSKYAKYVVTLTKFSGLISCWNSEKGGIKNQMVSALQKYIDEKCGDGYICRHIYWHEVYALLKDNFSDVKMQRELLAFLKSQNLDRKWHQDMGCPLWRKKFNDAYRKFARERGLPESGNINKTTRMDKEGNEKPNLGKIKLSGTGDFFAGARLQGARAAELSGNCSVLQLSVDEKIFDLSEFFDEDAEKCVEKCSDAILKAYGK